MDFKKSKMDFREADRRYAELKRQHDAGTIDDEEFDTQLKEQLMVRDDKNRWWVKSRRRWRADGICWFVDDAREMIARAFALAALIGEAGVPARKVATRRPGTILYRDPWQIVAKPEETTPVTWH